MGYYLLEHPQTVKQYRETRRNGSTPSGVVVLHTAENVTDADGPDSGAEAVAKWITRRTNYGSYHRLCDADSTVEMVPWGMEAWHDTRTNNHSVGISGAIKSAHWPVLGERGQAIVVRMAAEAISYARWLKTNLGIAIPPRKISQAQAMARVPGFVAHGTMDPGRRSDPGAHFDWDLFLAAYVGQELPAPTTPVPTPTDALEYAMDSLDLRNAHLRPVTSRHVDNLQGLLLAAGYGPSGLVGADGRPDCVGGAATRAAAGDWQRRTNTGDGKGNPDYIFGAKSWKSLIEF